MTPQCLNLECKFLPNACVEYKWAQREEKISLYVEIPGRNSQRQQEDVVVSVRGGGGGVLTSEQGRRGDGRGSKVRSPGRRFSQMSISPAESSFLLRSSSVHMLIVWMCIEAADLQQPRLIPLSADYCSRYRLHQKVTLARRGFSLLLFLLLFFFCWKDENLFWSLRGSGLQLREVESSRCVCY